MRKNVLGLCLVILCLSVGLAFAESKKINLHALNSSIGLLSGEDIMDTEGITVFEVLRAVTFWLSPVIFFVGILLILFGNYKKLETIFDRELGIRKKILPKLENNNYAFHQWLLEKNTLVGLICIAFALAFFFVLR